MPCVAWRFARQGHQSELQAGGFFYYVDQPINTSVSAVIFCENIQPTAFAGTRITVWDNPFAARSVSLNQFPFEQYYFEKKDHYLQPRKIATNFDIIKTLGIDPEIYFEYLKLKHKKAQVSQPDES